MGYGGGGGGGTAEWGDYLLFAEALHFHIRDNFAPVTPRVIWVCVFFITVASSPIASVKWLCVGCTKMRKRETVCVCPC